MKTTISGNLVGITINAMALGVHVANPFSLGEVRYAFIVAHFIACLLIAVSTRMYVKDIERRKSP
jgi:hypothetical protein